MTDEEKKAIERFKANANYCITSNKTTKTILNLIEKQQEEIERYKRIAIKKIDDIEEFRKNECEHRCVRNAEVTELKEYYNENYINKDKIRAKIKEINNEKLNYSEDEYYLENEIKGYTIDKLKELLEEEV